MQAPGAREIHSYCADSCTYIRCLTTSFGWGGLSVCPSSIELLLVELQVFDDFRLILSAFGPKAFAQDEGYSECRVAMRKNSRGCVQIVGQLASKPSC